MDISCTLRATERIDEGTYVVDQGRSDGIEPGQVCHVVTDTGETTGQVVDASETHSVVQLK